METPTQIATRRALDAELLAGEIRERALAERSTEHRARLDALHMEAFIEGQVWRRYLKMLEEGW